jgi:hypothetical protein
LGDLEETDPVAEAAQRRLAAFAVAEIERIIADLAEPISPISPLPAAGVRP